MLSLLLSMAGAFPFYRRSKYFPAAAPAFKVAPYWGYALLCLSILAAILEFGIASGVLVGLVTLILGYSVLVFVMPLPKWYRLGFGIFLCITTLISYASTK